MSITKYFEKMVHLQYVKRNKFKSCLERVSPLTAMIPEERHGGKAIVTACSPAGHLGLSYDPAAATTVASQNNASASDYEEFVQSFGDYSHHFILEDKDIAASQGGSAVAFVENKLLEFQKVVQSFQSAAAQKIWGPVGGALGRILDIDQGGGNGEIELYEAPDAFNFANNQILQAAAASGSSTTSPRAGLGYVSLVDPTGATTGTSTTGWQIKVGTSTALAQAGTSGLPQDWVDNDYLFRYGDVQTGANLSDKQIRSIQGFIPLANDTSDYLGAKRTQRGMNGVRLPAALVAGYSIKERVEMLADYMQAQFNSTEIDTVGVGIAAFRELRNDAAVNTYQKAGSSLEVGSNHLEIHAGGKTLKVVSDPFVKNADLWVLSMSRMKLYTHTGFPGPIDGDSLKMLRLSGRNAYEVRFAAYSCLDIGGEPWQFGRTDSGISVNALI